MSSLEIAGLVFVLLVISKLLDHIFLDRKQRWTCPTCGLRVSVVGSPRMFDTFVDNHTRLHDEQ